MRNPPETNDVLCFTLALASSYFVKQILDLPGRKCSRSQRKISGRNNEMNLHVHRDAYTAVSNNTRPTPRTRVGALSWVPAGQQYTGAREGGCGWPKHKHNSRCSWIHRAYLSNVNMVAEQQGSKCSLDKDPARTQDNAVKQDGHGQVPGRAWLALSTCPTCRLKKIPPQLLVFPSP